MSEVEELQNEIIVDFNNNDTFSKIKNQVQEIEDKPKPKRKSTKQIIAEQVEVVEAVEAAEPIEDIEDIKPKPKRKNQLNK